MPDLRNFRKAKVLHYRRFFGHVAPVFFERGIARPETKVSMISKSFLD
jgi:hypothetical protein